VAFLQPLLHSDTRNCFKTKMFVKADYLGVSFAYQQHELKSLRDWSKFCEIDHPKPTNSGIVQRPEYTGAQLEPVMRGL
jgi:hypothetical protein